MTKSSIINTPLQPHQQLAVDRAKGEISGLILAHGTGSGKTLSSLAIADALGMPTDIVAPAALLPNIQNEIQKHYSGDPSLFHLISMQGLYRHPERLASDPNRALIIDEAHRLRNVGTETYRLLSKTPRSKKILLTATPIYNKPEDLSNMINIIHPATNPDELKSRRDALYDLKLRGNMKQYLDLYTVPQDSLDYPSVSFEDIKIPMSSKQYTEYNKYFREIPENLLDRLRDTTTNKLDVTEEMNPFLIKTRMIANTFEGESPKIDRAVEDIKKEPGKTVVYSNFLDSGLREVGKRLDRDNIPYAYFTGEEKNRDRIVKDYNEGKIKTLLLSSAGGEGLDLKGTRQIQILEPHWNEEKINQVIGRGVRYRSHENLPPEERNVKIKQYLSTTPDKPGLQTIDTYLKNISAYKRSLGKQILESFRV